jgi:CHAD domain-containing protein
MSSALPPGPVRARLAEVAGERALLPAARVVSNLQALRARNADCKTVAWLTVDHSAATTPAPAQLPGRLSVTPVRGYQIQANRIAQALAQASGLEPAALPQLEEALAAAGRHPGDYSGKVDVTLTSGMPARLAMKAVLLQLLGTLEANVAGTVRDTDTEFLHDLRVAVRRTRTALKLAGAVLPDGLAAEFAAEFAWLGTITTPARDLDVHLLAYPATAASLAAAAPAELEPFREHLAARRARERRRLVRVLRSRRFGGLTASWRGALTGLSRPGRGLTAGQLAARVIGRAHRKVLRLGAAITGSSPPEHLHDLRKRCKELRYALEFFASLCDPAACRQAVKDLKGLQDVLGTFQDCQVQRQEIRTAAAEMMAARDVPATALLAMGDLAAQVARAERRARGEFAGRFAEFASEASQQRFRTLLPVGGP